MSSLKTLLPLLLLLWCASCFLRRSVCVATVADDIAAQSASLSSIGGAVRGAGMRAAAAGGGAALSSGCGSAMAMACERTGRRTIGTTVWALRSVCASVGAKCVCRAGRGATTNEREHVCALSVRYRTQLGAPAAGCLLLACLFVWLAFEWGLWTVTCGWGSTAYGHSGRSRDVQEVESVREHAYCRLGSMTQSIPQRFV